MLKLYLSSVVRSAAAGCVTPTDRPAFVPDDPRAPLRKGLSVGIGEGDIPSFAALPRSYILCQSYTVDHNW